MKLKKSKTNVLMFLYLNIIICLNTNAAIEYNQNVTNNVIFGNFNNGSFTTDRNNGIEVGLRARIPGSNTSNSNNDGTYTFSLDETDHDNNPATDNRWKFDFSINTDFDDSTNDEVADYTYELGMDVDPGVGTNYLIVNPKFAVTLLFPDHSFGNNSTGQDSGVEAISAADYLLHLSLWNVMQNSQDYNRYSLINPMNTYDPDIPGTYSVYLIVRDGGSIVASSTIQVIIEGPPDAPTNMPDLTDATDTGLLNNDDITSDTTPTLSVMCSEVGNVINLYTDNPVANTLLGTHVCTTSQNEDAGVTNALAEGSHNITYTDESFAGESDPSPALNITVDSGAPVAPSCSTVPESANDGTLVTTTCTLVEEGSVLSIPGMTCNPTPANESEIVICSGTVGTDIITPNDDVSVTDDAGNVNSDSTTGLTIDNTAPSTPICTTSPSPAMNGTVITTTCTGVEETSVLSIPNMVCNPTPADASGIVICTATVGTDVTTPDDTVIVTDTVGNTNTSGNTGLEIDNEAPNNANCSITPDPANDNTPLTATCTGVETGGSVSIPDFTCGNENSGTVICTGVAGTNPGQISGDVIATTADLAGNTTDSNIPFELDNDAPNGASCTTMPNPANSGTILTATCTGVEPGGSVTIPNYACAIEFNGTVTCIAIAGISPGQISGDQMATTYDAAGNTNSSDVPFVLDNDAPLAPSIDPIGNDYTSITGAAESLTEVTLAGTNCTNEPIIADVNGNWTCTLSDPLPTGTMVSAAATDTAGNTSGITNSTVLHVNHAPSFNMSCDIDATDVTSDSSVTIQFSDFITNMLVGPESEDSQTYDLQIATVTNGDPDDIVSSMTLLNTGELTLDINVSNSGVATLEITMTDDGGTAVGGVDTTSIVFNVHNYADWILDPDYQHLDQNDMVYKNKFDMCR